VPHHARCNSNQHRSGTAKISQTVENDREKYSDANSLGISRAKYFAGFGIVDRNLPYQNANIEYGLVSLFVRPERLMNSGNVFPFSGDPQLVSVFCCLVGRFRGVFAQAQLGSLFTVGHYSSERLRH
jgi:hypothetical protein